jgi:hypothetical protein
LTKIITVAIDCRNFDRINPNQSLVPAQYLIGFINFINRSITIFYLKSLSAFSMMERQS